MVHQFVFDPNHSGGHFLIQASISICSIVNQLFLVGHVSSQGSHNGNGSDLDIFGFGGTSDVPPTALYITLATIGILMVLAILFTVICFCCGGRHSGGGKNVIQSFRQVRQYRAYPATQSSSSSSAPAKKHKKKKKKRSKKHDTSSSSSSSSDKSRSRNVGPSTTPIVINQPAYFTKS